MKIILALCIGLIANCVIAQSPPPRYIVAVKQQPGLQLSNGHDWQLKIGEVFPFTRFVSASEAKGGANDPSDKSYVLVQLDDQTMIAPTACFQRVEDSQLTAASATYQKMVADYKQATATASKQQQGKKQPMSREAMLALASAMQKTFDKIGGMTASSKLPPAFRDEMISKLLGAGIIATPHEGESMPDSKLKDLYFKRLVQPTIDSIKSNAMKSK